MTPRLEPIEEPDEPEMQSHYRMMREEYGTVLTPVKVVFARMPGAMELVGEFQEFHANGIQLEPEFKHMVGTLISEINGCGFCVDIARSAAIRENLGMEKFNALTEYQTNPLFSERERAALAYAEEITRDKTVSDATFEELREHFDEREIVELTWLTAMENYNNLVNIPLGIESDGLCAIARSETEIEHDK